MKLTVLSCRRCGKPHRDLSPQEGWYLVGLTASNTGARWGLCPRCALIPVPPGWPRGKGRRNEGQQQRLL